MMTVIYLHPEITIAEMNRLALPSGLRLATDKFGHYVLEPQPQSRLPSGARYVSSEATNVRNTIERAKAQRSKPPDG